MKLLTTLDRVCFEVVAGLLVLALSPFLVRAQDSKRPNPSDTNVAAAELVSDQAAAVVRAMMNETPNGLHLRQVVLTLQTGTTLEKGVEIDLVVFTYSNKKKIGLTDTTTLSFDDKQLQALGAEAKPPSLDEQFKKQLDEAVKAQMALNWGKHKSISLKKEFVVTKDTAGGITLKITTPVTASGSFKVDRTKTSVNSLQLTYSE